MLFARILLGVTGLMFVLYGAMCAIDPTTPAQYTGLSLGSGAGPAEIMAMYGGLQFAVGLYLLLCTKDTGRTLQGLEALAFIIGGLGIARVAAIAIYGADPYNLTVGIYEIISLALVLLARKKLLTQ